MTVEDKRKYVVLVNPQGQETGYEEKLKAHQEGTLHKAFSIFIVNTAGEMLLQQRALGKYHFAGLWSNTCCSHPIPEEDLLQAAHRRLKEEMGFDTPLSLAFSFIYKTQDTTSGLFEHELDYVFTGVYDGVIEPDQQEIEAYRWVPLTTLYEEVRSTPERFTEWFKIGLSRLKDQAILTDATL